MYILVQVGRVGWGVNDGHTHLPSISVGKKEHTLTAARMVH